MAEDKQNVTLYAGDNLRLLISVTDENGAALDLTGYSAVWTMAENAGDTAVVTKSTDGGAVTIVGDAVGHVAIALSPVDTAQVGRWWHQLVITSPGGAVSTVTTGSMTIKPRS